MAQSSIAWIDFSEQDHQRMIEVVSLFKNRDTRDELGLGPIRDAFADGSLYITRELTRNW